MFASFALAIGAITSVLFVKTVLRYWGTSLPATQMWKLGTSFGWFQIATSIAMTHNNFDLLAIGVFCALSTMGALCTFALCRRASFPRSATSRRLGRLEVRQLLYTLGIIASFTGASIFFL